MVTTRLSVLQARRLGIATPKPKDEEPKKKSKFNNEKTVSDDIAFDSKREERRYKTLKQLEKYGHISDLKLQVVFTLVKSVKYSNATRAKPPIRYVADFVYRKDGKTIVEDAKGHLTDVYILKKHLMLANLGIEIQEV